MSEEYNLPLARHTEYEYGGWVKIAKWFSDLSKLLCEISCYFFINFPIVGLFLYQLSYFGTTLGDYGPVVRLLCHAGAQRSVPHSRESAI